MRESVREWCKGGGPPFAARLAIRVMGGSWYSNECGVRVRFNVAGPVYVYSLCAKSLHHSTFALTVTRLRLEAAAEQRWLMIGGGLVLAGLVLGLVIKSRPRRSAWT